MTCDNIDDLRSELRNVTDDHLSELEETYRESMDQLEAKRIQCLDHIQNQEVASKEENIAKFKLNLTRRRQDDGSRLPLCKRQYLGQSYLQRRYRGFSQHKRRLVKCESDQRRGSIALETGDTCQSRSETTGGASASQQPGEDEPPGFL